MNVAVQILTDKPKSALVSGADFDLHRPEGLDDSRLELQQPSGRLSKLLGHFGEAVDFVVVEPDETEGDFAGEDGRHAEVAARHRGHGQGRVAVENGWLFLLELIFARIYGKNGLLQTALVDEVQIDGGEEVVGVLLVLPYRHLSFLSICKAYISPIRTLNKRFFISDSFFEIAGRTSACFFELDVCSLDSYRGVILTVLRFCLFLMRNIHIALWLQNEFRITRNFPNFISAV